MNEDSHFDMGKDLSFLFIICNLIKLFYKSIDSGYISLDKVNEFSSMYKKI